MLELTEKEKELLNKYNKKNVRIALDYKESGTRPGKMYRNTSFICTCQKCAEKDYPVQNYNSDYIYSAVKCEHGTYGYFEYAVKGCSIPRYMLRKSKKKCYMLKVHPDNPNGIRFLVLEDNIVLEKDRSKPSGIVPKYEFVVKNYVDFIPGETIKGYRVLKRSNKEIPVLDAINLNSCNNKKIHENFYIEGSDTLYEFLENNESFAKKSGLYDFFRNTKRSGSELSIFLTYIALIEQYPVLELLIKMNHTNLVDNIMKSVWDCSSQIEIKSVVKNFTKLLNKEESKGSKALRLPKYIADDLANKRCGLSDYIVWSNIYEITKLSKEQYENFINSHEYMYVKNCLSSLPNILKYGYDISVLARYIKKQSSELFKSKQIGWHSNCVADSSSYICGIMKDYLSMCECNGIIPDRKPKNIINAHDDMCKIIRMKEDEKVDLKLCDIANYYDSEIKKSPKTPEEETAMAKQFEIVFPKSINDFVNEGNKMSSCIGHYANKVANGDCIVFFIRNKEEPNESFISAEYIDGHLGQCEYECTIPVTNKEILEYCRVICNKIHRAKLKREAEEAA